jgi:PAS domain S-box-containing protein
MKFNEIGNLLFRNSPTPILIWDTNGKILDYNPSFEQLLGFSAIEVQDINQFSLSISNDKEKNLLSKLKEFESRTYFKTFLNKKNEKVFTKVNSYPIYDNNKLLAYTSYIQEAKQEKKVTSSTGVLKKQNTILLKLAKSDVIDSGDIEKALQEITEAATLALDCERSSVWAYTNDGNAIISLDLFQVKEQTHSKDVTLMAKDFPSYFKYLNEERSLAADDANTDPNTFEFSEVYLKPLGISSMLDAPIRLSGKMLGVICNEHVGEKRIWSQEEQNFSASLADITSRAFEAYERKKAQDELKTLNLELENRVEERTIELTEEIEKANKLKTQQDGDYYLTSLILKPLCINLNKSFSVKTDFYLKQKKEFQFKKFASEIGGDICISGNLRFGDGKTNHVFIFNGDAMGKSMQGAGGAIVLGTAVNNIMNLSSRNNRILNISPEEWLVQTASELNNIFLTFSGTMFASAFLGLIDETTGELFYINADHPFSVLYREKKASFIESEYTMKKLGIDDKLDIKAKRIILFSEDIVMTGSDGRDAIESFSNIINEDQNLFLQIVEESDGDLEKMIEVLKSKGNLIDDLSLISTSFRI